VPVSRYLSFQSHVQGREKSISHDLSKTGNPIALSVYFLVRSLFVVVGPFLSATPSPRLSPTLRQYSPRKGTLEGRARGGGNERFWREKTHFGRVGGVPALQGAPCRGDTTARPCTEPKQEGGATTRIQAYLSFTASWLCRATAMSGHSKGAFERQIDGTGAARGDEGIHVRQTKRTSGGVYERTASDLPKEEIPQTM